MTGWKRVLFGNATALLAIIASSGVARADTSSSPPSVPVRESLHDQGAAGSARSFEALSLAERLGLALGLAGAEARRAFPRLLRRLPNAFRRASETMGGIERRLARPVEARLGETIVQLSYGISAGLPGVANVLFTFGPVLAGAASGHPTMGTGLAFVTTPLGEVLFLLRRKRDEGPVELPLAEWLQRELKLRVRLGFSVPLGPFGWFAMAEHPIHRAPWTGLIAPHVGALFVGRGEERGTIGLFVVLSPASANSPTISLVMSHPAILRRYAPVIDALVAGNLRAKVAFEEAYAQTAPADPQSVPELLSLWDHTTEARPDWRELIEPFAVLVREVMRTAGDALRTELERAPREVLADHAAIVRSMALWQERPRERGSARALASEILGKAVHPLRSSRSGLAALGARVAAEWRNRTGEAARIARARRRNGREDSRGRSLARAERRERQRSRALPRLARLVARRQEARAAWQARLAARRYWE